MAGPSLIATQTGAQPFLGPGIQIAVFFVPVSVVSVPGVQIGAQPFLGPGIQLAVPLSLFLLCQFQGYIRGIQMQAGGGTLPEIPFVMQIQPGGISPPEIQASRECRTPY